MRHYCCAILFSLLALPTIVGCGGPEGPEVFRVSGTATFLGNPIPQGIVMVTPDGSKKNSGPQAEIPIRDGVFDTTFKSGEGFAGGPARVQVTGLTEKGGALCDYEFFVDLPKADSTHTFDVPKEGKAKPSGDI